MELQFPVSDNIYKYFLKGSSHFLKLNKSFVLKDGICARVEAAQ